MRKKALKGLGVLKIKSILEHKTLKKRVSFVILLIKKCVFPLFKGVGTKLPSSISRSVQTSARHVLDSCGRGGKERRRDRHHGQTPEPTNSLTLIHWTQL